MKGKIAAALAGFAVVMALAAKAPPRADELAPAPQGPVVLTIAGAVETGNRGPLEPFADAFLKYHDKRFERAFAFDRAMLARLPQQGITAHARTWPAAVRLRGPLFADVLREAGVLGRTVTVFALDGYGVEITPELLEQEAWVLAIEADGRPLSIGGRGPAWLAYDTSGRDPVGEEEEGRWVWSVFYVEAR